MNIRNCDKEFSIFLSWKFRFPTRSKSEINRIGNSFIEELKFSPEVLIANPDKFLYFSIEAIDEFTRIKCDF